MFVIVIGKEHPQIISRSSPSALVLYRIRWLDVYRARIRGRQEIDSLAKRTNIRISQTEDWMFDVD
jgi:hypothetical protein